MAANGSPYGMNQLPASSEIPEFEHSPISEPPFSPPEKSPYFDPRSPSILGETVFDYDIKPDLEGLPTKPELEEISQTDIDEVFQSENMDVANFPNNNSWLEELSCAGNVIQSENIPNLDLSNEFVVLGESSRQRIYSDVSSINMENNYEDVDLNVQAWTFPSYSSTASSCQSVASPSVELLDISQIKREADEVADPNYCCTSVLPGNDWAVQENSYLSTSTESYQGEETVTDAGVLDQPGDRQPQRRLKLKTLPVEERKARRRMQNRDAARRCRMKKRQSASTLVQDYHQLIASQRSMTQEIAELKRSKAAMEEMLREHSKKCPIMKRMC